MILSAILLGFADDVLDLKWRHKLAFPTLSSLPVLMVYYVSGGSTTVVIPSIIRSLLTPIVPSWISPSIPSSINIHFLYYIFMCMVVVFCTNAINILAGVNGLESGQALVVAMSVVIFNLIQVSRLEDQQWDHLLSLYFLIPFLACTLALYQFNKYPARVFVGDTFCYWAGMTLAVVSILGHFSKTMILFLIPQVFNFLYSIPQLFKLVPCPRHRLPRFDPETDTVGMSKAEFKESDLKMLGKLALRLFSSFGLLHSRSFERDGERWQEINNLTILNLSTTNLTTMDRSSSVVHEYRRDQPRMGRKLLAFHRVTNCIVKDIWKLHLYSFDSWRDPNTVNFVILPSRRSDSSVGCRVCTLSSRG
ncbi:hypothetical protein RB195_013288 [Necator americanus]|uniref:UDP-N-acetylglucosamine--dolichyl-phosphate N-acetylglucosaminephosphotransferase n=1 Tax=Necator americanus TaxID=51031 RepID=A0ABR1DV08_NECAM